MMGLTMMLGMIAEAIRTSNLGVCVGPFAGKPAPTGTAPSLSSARSLWERVYPRKGRHRFTSNQIDNRTTRLSSTCCSCPRRLFTTNSPIAISRVRVMLRDNPSNCAVCTWL